MYSLTRDEIVELNKRGEILVVANNYIYNAKLFLKHHAHPGGNIFAETIARYERDNMDASRDHHFHSTKARKIWSRFCVARLDTKECSCIVL